VVEEVLRDCFAHVCLAALLDVDGLETLADELGYSSGVDSLKLYPLGAVEGQVVAVFLLEPVGCTEDHVVSGREVNFQIQISGLGGIG
jgi:hypothetical protein